MRSLIVILKQLIGFYLMTIFKNKPRLRRKLEFCQLSINKKRIKKSKIILLATCYLRTGIFKTPDFKLDAVYRRSQH